MDYVLICPKDRITLRLRETIKKSALNNTYSKIVSECSITKQTVRNVFLEYVKKRIVVKDSVMLKGFNRRNIKHLLGGAIENLDEGKQKKSDYLLRAFPDLQIAYSIKETFRLVYEYLAVLKTIKNWYDEIFNLVIIIKLFLIVLIVCKTIAF